MKKDCIFCKISAGKMGTEFLYEDDICVIFKDRNPKAKTHLLIVPKEHIETLIECPDDKSPILSHMMMKARDIAKELGLEGYNIQLNVGKEGGQEIFHIHFHLLSRF